MQNHSPKFVLNKRKAVESGSERAAQPAGDAGKPVNSADPSAGRQDHSTLGESGECRNCRRIVLRRLPTGGRVMTRNTISAIVIEEGKMKVICRCGNSIIMMEKNSSDSGNWESQWNNRGPFADQESENRI